MKKKFILYFAIMALFAACNTSKVKVTTLNCNRYSTSTIYAMVTTSSAGALINCKSYSDTLIQTMNIAGGSLLVYKTRILRNRHLTAAEKSDPNSGTNPTMEMINRDNIDTTKNYVVLYARDVNYVRTGSKEVIMPAYLIERSRFDNLVDAKDVEKLRDIYIDHVMDYVEL